MNLGEVWVVCRQAFGWISFGFRQAYDWIQFVLDKLYGKNCFALWEKGMLIIPDFLIYH